MKQVNTLTHKNYSLNFAANEQPQKSKKRRYSKFILQVPNGIKKIMLMIGSSLLKERGIRLCVIHLENNL